MSKDYTLTSETFDSLRTLWDKSQNSSLRWDLIFTLPDWMQTWWQTFGSRAQLHLRAVRQADKVIGIAPLQVRDGTASIAGSVNVCDYLDFVTSAGTERDFFKTLLDGLAQAGVTRLDLRPLRPDSSVLGYLVDVARERGYPTTVQPEDVTLEMDLPPSWDEYLESTLNTKQRHEIRRKLRRIAEAGKADFRVVTSQADVKAVMDNFLKFFRESRADKDAFMTARMETYFRSMAEAMANIGLLRFGVLELDKMPTAMVMCFDYKDHIYLYNSGYDPRYEEASPGLISKVFAIKDSIERGKKKFDFLKGGEQYKYQLGGKEVQLSRCQIVLGRE